MEHKRDENVEFKETADQKAVREFKEKALATFGIKADNPMWSYTLFQITWALFEKIQEVKDLKQKHDKEMKEIKDAWCPPPFDPNSAIAQRAKGEVDALFAKSRAGNDGGVDTRSTQLANQQYEYDRRVAKIQIILRKRLPRFIAKIHYLKAAVAFDQKAGVKADSAQLQLQEYKKNKRKAIEDMRQEEAKMRQAAKAAAEPDLDNPDKVPAIAAAAAGVPKIIYIDSAGQPVDRVEDSQPAKRRKLRLVEVSDDEAEQEATAEDLDDTKDADDASYAKYLLAQSKKKKKNKLKGLPAPQTPAPDQPAAEPAPTQQSQNPGQGPMQLEPLG